LGQYVFDLIRIFGDDYEHASKHLHRMTFRRNFC
jgi:hypothetical protein